jgi:hypothetical protein
LQAATESEIARPGGEPQAPAEAGSAAHGGAVSEILGPVAGEIAKAPLLLPERQRVFGSGKGFMPALYGALSGLTSGEGLAMITALHKAPPGIGEAVGKLFQAGMAAGGATAGVQAVRSAANGDWDGAAEAAGASVGQLALIGLPELRRFSKSYRVALSETERPVSAPLETYSAADTFGRGRAASAFSSAEEAVRTGVPQPDVAAAREIAAKGIEGARGLSRGEIEAGLQKAQEEGATEGAAAVTKRRLDAQLAELDRRAAERGLSDATSPSSAPPGQAIATFKTEAAAEERAAGHGRGQAMGLHGSAGGSRQRLDARAPGEGGGR